MTASPGAPSTKFQMQDSCGGVYYDEKAPVGWDRDSKAPAMYAFKLKLFSQKARPTGLHKISLQFTKRVGLRRTVILQDDSPRHGPCSIRASAMHHEFLTVIQLPAGEWQTEDVIGFVRCNAALSEAEEVWFVAQFQAGGTFRQKVADLSRRIGVSA